MNLTQERVLYDLTGNLGTVFFLDVGEHRQYFVCFRRQPNVYAFQRLAHAEIAGFPAPIAFPDWSSGGMTLEIFNDLFDRSYPWIRRCAVLDL